MVYGVWYGVWCMVYGVWCMVWLTGQSKGACFVHVIGMEEAKAVCCYGACVWFGVYELYCVWCILCLCMVYGVWCMVYGVWCMVYGVWCMVCLGRLF